MHGQSVFLITQNEDLSGLDVDDDNFSTDCAVQMYPCPSSDDADTVLENISTFNVDTDNCRAYSGALFSVKEIPKNFKGLTPYLIINAAADGSVYLDLMEGTFKKLPKDVDKVCDAIATVLSTKVRIEMDDGYLYDDYPDVDSMYLFVGKQVELSLNMSPEAIDEELLDRVDSICDAVDDGNSIVINEYPTSNKGDEQMSKNEVLLTINHSEEAGLGQNAIFKVEGRLLGICTTEEALKIVQNKEVARKVHTMGDVPLAKAAKLIADQNEANQKVAKALVKHTHLVLAIKEIKNMNTSRKVWPKSRKLYLTPPIDLVSGSSDSAEMASAVFECTDGSMCSALQKYETEA